MKRGLSQTDIPGTKAPVRGKVRDIYDLGDRLLIVATDRISAFDVVLAPPIPDKGRILSLISAFWFRRLGSRVPHHLLTMDPGEFPEPFRSHAELLTDRAMLVLKTEPILVECVARGYLAGSAYQEYKTSGSVCGIPLPGGLEEAARLPDPVFTPATKAESGHDENIDFITMAGLVGEERAASLRGLSIDLYREAADYCLERGIILADTKFEFGISPSGEIIWIDEALTPDSSRFWPKEQYRQGSSPPSFDKQFVRDFLIGVDWNRKPPAPVLPGEVVARTRAKYIEAYEAVTGNSFE